MAAELQRVPLAQDAVFRPPTVLGKAELGRLRKQPPPGQALEGALDGLFGQPDGPALARLAVQDKDPRVAVAAVRAAAVLAERHPRLYAFLPTLDARTSVELAQAIVQFDFATGCDTPVHFALDALHHPDARVVAMAAHGALDLAEATTASAPLNRTVQWLADAKGSPALRVAIARRLGNAGFVQLLPLWQRLAADRDLAVAAEAQVAAARLSPAAARGWVKAAMADRSPWRQITALRAAPLAYAFDPDALSGHLARLCASSAFWRDAANGAPVRVADVCARVSALLRAEAVDAMPINPSTSSKKARSR